MASQSKSEKVKIWIKEYLSEFGEYCGTLEELANLANSTSYLTKKAISELEEEGLINVETKRGKGLVLTLKTEKEDSQKEPQLEPIKEEKSEEELLKEREERKKKKVSLQDQVLTSLLGKEITVFLISGTRLEGKLLDFDNFTLSMTAPKGKSLVYKHAIATILYE
ncbi:RNA chaperone Hfq [Desulfurobacterium pacificum]|uniref:RNA chaperone Hfq n=1 Tax=Desulfurobacterium pacificum TaxID=240166 RepID=A0ABY1NKC8_9BACT|nr:RNA chaperone Hfq [Desulfurobacterium pacificum]SMP11353.1 RNA chaperone Hfq [Desulfurobacterium pacificum]